MPHSNEEVTLAVIVQTLQRQMSQLEVEFRYFRNIMITLYLTIVAPLVVAIFLNVLGGK